MSYSYQTIQLTMYIFHNTEISANFRAVYLPFRLTWINMDWFCNRCVTDIAAS